MKKIGIIGFLLCLLLGGWSFLLHSETASSADMGSFLTEAYTATGASVEGYTVHNWSVLDQQYRTPDQLKQLGHTLNKSFGIAGAEETATSDGDTVSYALRGTWANGAQVQIVLKSMKFTEHAPQTALVLRVEKDGQELGDFTHAIEKVRDTALGANAVPQISTCIKGFLADKMEGGESNALVEKTFSAVNAKEIEGVRSDLVTSVSGYSPYSKDYIVTNGNKMNLQVAVHYDAHQGKTRVLVGSPIVTIEY